MSNPTNISQATTYLSALCARTEYCVSDIRRKMRLWEMPEDMKDEIVTILLKNKFIDESRYAKAFARDKFRYNKWGWVKIQMELRRKGLQDNDIESAKEEIAEEDVNSALRAMLESKRRTIQGKNDYDIKAKLFRFALSRGFTYGQIEAVLDTDD